MLSCKHQNYHHSKLPRLGDIGYLIMGHNRWGEARYYGDSKQRYQVIGYPLCDNIQPYSVGIHTAYFQNLRDGSIHRLSGFYFDEKVTA